MKTPSLLPALLTSGSLLWMTACGGGDGAPPPAATLTQTSTVARTATLTATRTPTPTSTATVTPTSTATPIVTPAVPDNLQVPPGNSAFRVGHAVGTQDYVCLPAGEGFAWALFGPQATLFDDHEQQIITHFLSPNPDESGTPRPTWEDSEDTSAVSAKMTASSTDQAFVAAGAIPWFLLQVVGSQPGPTDGDTLTGTTYIQRLNTSGGVAPAAGCAQASDVGAKALVPYTADYYFFSN